MENVSIAVLFKEKDSCMNQLNNIMNGYNTSEIGQFHVMKIHKVPNNAISNFSKAFHKP